jgi:hypothetical protein
MAGPTPASPGFTQRAKKEFLGYLGISAYLALFFCALVIYTRLILRQYSIYDETLNLAFALINALIIGKIIVLGEMIRLGKYTATSPLYLAVLVRAFLFSLLVVVFHFAEEFVERLYRGEPSGTVFHEIRIYELLARSLVVFCAFIPLFAFRELGHTLGIDKVRQLFLAPRKAPVTTGPAIS